MTTAATTTRDLVLTLGDCALRPVVRDGLLTDLGAVAIGGRRLRGGQVRFLPWFDSFEGDVFRQFRLEQIDQEPDRVTLTLTAQSDPDVMFRERRDSSGDPMLRADAWDGAPQCADVRIVLEPAEHQLGNRRLRGFRYHFEYAGPVAIHRLIDRQTWELDGSVDGLRLCLRNWTNAPVTTLSTDEAFSSGAPLDGHFGGFPGHLWARWSLLPAFDMQYRDDAVLLAWFDDVSLIRTLIESSAGEPTLRCLDMHLFERSTRFATNPKTVLLHEGPMDDTAALNLWTQVMDQQQARAVAALDVPAPPPPKVCVDQVHWVDYHFDRSYEALLDTAQRVGAEAMYIDPVWINEQHAAEAAARRGEQADDALGAMRFSTMCSTLDFQVAPACGGEAALKRLCDRAAQRGVRVISWLAAHLSPRTRLAQDPRFKDGRAGLFAMSESGLHPDTGYPGECWPLHLSGPAGDYFVEQVLAVCQRTGLGGFLWDSFSNLGWWQLDYANQTMKPQYTAMIRAWRRFAQSGLILRPEGLTSLSNQSCLCCIGGDYYADPALAGYAYKSAIPLPEQVELGLITGQTPIDRLVRCIAHLHVPAMRFAQVPRADWDPDAAAQIRRLFELYRRVRDRMVRRSVLPDDQGVYWRDAQGHRSLLFVFHGSPPADEDADAWRCVFDSGGGARIFESQADDDD